MKPLTPASPHAIIMIGVPGAGKTAFAEHFADTFQAPIISPTRLVRDFDLSTPQADTLADQMIAELLKTQRTILLDGGFDKRARRAELYKRLETAGYKPLLVWVQTDSVESQRRATRPYPQGSGLNSEEFTRTVKQFQLPTQKEGAIVISGKHTYATQLKVVLKQLALSVPRPE